MPEASMNVAAPGQPHNNNLSKKKAEAKNSNTTPGPGNTPKLPNISRSLSNNFELDTDNDNWPEVDLGNIIIGLDEDIDKTMSNASTPPAGPGTVSLNRQSGNSGSVATLTETIPATDKSLKMKIKRSKSGSRGHIEGKMEIIQANEKLEDSEGSSQGSVSNGSPDPARLNAAEIVAAVKQCTKNTGSITGFAASNSNKFRLAQNTSSNNQQVQQQQSSPSSSGSSKKLGLALMNNGPRVVGEKSANGSASSSSSKSSTQVGFPSTSDTSNKVSSNSLTSSSSSGSGGLLLGEGKAKQQTSGSSKQGSNFILQKQNSEPPSKKQKIDASVGTEMGTMTEPECLGPLDPGTSVTLEGIVWHETDGGVLVINVTWRGKTYVGTLLDSTKHVNQWAPPRYSESPTSELDGRTPKGRSKRNRGTPVEVETRKNLRSSKVKTRTNPTLANSPAKRKGRPGEGGDEKRPRNDSSRNSPDDDEDSEKEQRDSNKEKENESDRESTSSAKVKEEKDDDFTPKDKEEEKYVPPPPLPFTLLCPKTGCSKRYRHHNGLRYHVAHAHPELLNDHGDIKETDDIQKMERAEKDKEREKEADPDAPEASEDADAEPKGERRTVSGEPRGSAEAPKKDRRETDAAAAPDASPLAQGKPPVGPPHGVKPVRPPAHARPIVPATGPQVMAGEAPPGSAASHLKPIQPKPTIMADPAPRLGLDDLRKAKKEAKKKGRSPTPSPTRNGGAPPSVGRGHGHGNGKAEGPGGGDGTATERVARDAKSPAYSDISDDNEDGAEKRRGDPAPCASPKAARPNPPGTLAAAPPGPSPSHPAVPVSLPSALPAPFFYPPFPPLPLSGGAAPPKAEALSPRPVKKEPVAAPTGPLPGSHEYQKMLEAYGFPPFPYPAPPGADPTHPFQLLAGDPAYKAKFERDRSEKERAFKDHLDRDAREKERRAGAASGAGAKAYDEPRRTPEDLRKHGGGSRTPNASPRSAGLHVKPEFRGDVKPDLKPPAPPDEGVKPTMETRGPPPSNAYNFFHPAFFRPPGIHFDPILQHSLLSLPGYGPNPYLSSHLAAAAAAGYRPPFPLPGASPEDLSRPSSATKALDLLHQHASQASQYYTSMANSVSAGLGSPLSAHKIHELHERALKSPSSGKSSPAPSFLSGVTSLSQLTSLSTGTTVTAATNTKSSTDAAGFRAKDVASPSLNPARLTPTSRGRSPPPLRHVHTHTHTHYGLGYPLLPPPPPGAVTPGPGVVAPPAHAPFPGPGFPPSLLSGKAGGLPTFQPK